MHTPVVYDKAEYHTTEDWPEDLDDFQSFVHTGMFLGWLIDHGLLSDVYVEDESVESEVDAIAAFKLRQMTGPQVFEWDDGALIDYMLNEEGNTFAQFYFDFERGQFLDDYTELLAARLPSIFHVEDTWENDDMLKARINQRYEDWKRQVQVK